MDTVELVSEATNINHKVVNWYAQKTEAILEKYGTGPRVHYHTGLVDPSIEPASNLDELRRQIWVSQEEMLYHAATRWNAAQNLSGKIVDIGCGLGGGSLFWAQEYGAHVTALTPVAKHLKLVSTFAEQVGVQDKVKPELGTAEEMPGHHRFDAAVTFDASNHFNRVLWFKRLASLLRPGGQVFIVDTFLIRHQLAAPFNDYWVSDIGTREEYLTAAKAANFDLINCENISLQAAGFWRLSSAYAAQSSREPAAKAYAVDWQNQMYQACLDGGVEVLLLHFKKSEQQ